jgi:hypothetical protein
MFEELRLLPQSSSIAFSTRGKPAITTIWRIRRSLFTLLIVKGVGKVDPKAGVVS